jgi:hypothetical protein
VPGSTYGTAPSGACRLRIDQGDGIAPIALVIRPADLLCDWGTAAKIAAACRVILCSATAFTCPDAVSGGRSVSRLHQPGWIARYCGQRRPAMNVADRASLAAVSRRASAKPGRGLEREHAKEREEHEENRARRRPSCSSWVFVPSRFKHLAAVSRRAGADHGVDNGSPATRSRDPHCGATFSSPGLSTARFPSARPQDRLRCFACAAGRFP